MLINALERCLESAKRKKWDKIYIAIDIHDTIVHGNYNANELPTEFIANSKEVLQYLSKREDIILLLYTCSHPTEIVKYIDFFNSNDIKFKHSNINPDIPNNALGCYDLKPYFNILLEDKAGFNAETDWAILCAFIKQHNFNFSE